MSRCSKVVGEGAAGLMDEIPGALCATGTCFQAASVSKHLVALSMTMLSEQGMLGLEDPVAQWWPKTPSTWDSMTVAYLLSHSSGLGHWGHITGMDILRPPPPEQILDQAAKLPLRHRPGSAWEYSGVGYLLAAAIIAAASPIANSSPTTSWAEWE
jgi:CubicO group peptidase (beta-lactamase class C family)